MDDKRKEYHGLLYVVDYKYVNRESYGYILRVEDIDYNVIKSYSDQCLDETEVFIDGSLLGLERGKEIGADNLRHDFRQLFNTGLISSGEKYYE